MKTLRKNILSILAGVALILASVLCVNLTPSKQTEVKAANSYQGKVVIYDYYVSSATTDNDHNLWSHTYFVLKNTTDTDISLANWTLHYIAKSGSASSFYTFGNNDVIKANGYIFFANIGSKVNINDTSYPQFIKDDYSNDSAYENFSVHRKGLNIGANGAMAICLTKLTSTSNVFITSLDDNVVDVLGLQQATSYLGSSTYSPVSAGTHLIRTAFNNDNTTDYTSENNYWNSETDNSLSYLIGNVEQNDNVSDALAKANGETATIKAMITHADNNNKVYTLQDNTGAVVVNVTSDTVLNYSVGTTIRATGTITDGKLNVTIEDTENTTFVIKSTGGSVSYKTTDIATINTNADNFYDNYAVSIQNVSFDGTDTLSDGTNTIKVTGIEEGAKKVSVKGIVRIVDGVKTLNVYSTDDYTVYNEYAYGQINTVRSLEVGTNTHFAVQGYITYVNGANAYLEDNNSGIQIYSTAFGNNVQLGDYVVLDATLATYNNNLQLNDVTVLSKETPDPAPAEPTITAVTLDSELPTLMHRSVSIAKAVVTSNTHASNNLFTIKINDTWTTYLEIDGGKDLDIQVGDELKINRGIVFYKNFSSIGNQLLTLKCNNSNEYFVQTTNNVGDTLGGTITEGMEVNVRGTITYIDTTTNKLIVQSNGAGAIVTNVTNASSLIEGNVVKVQGTLSTAGTYPTITASTVSTTTITNAETPEETTLNDLLTNTDDYEMLQVKLTHLKVLSVNEKVLTLTNGANTIELTVNYNHTLQPYDYLTVTAVAYENGLIASNQTEVVSEMITIAQAYNTTLNTEVIVRGTVTYIEIDSHDSQTGIENLIIQQTVGDKTHAIRLYFSEELAASDAVVLGDTITAMGKVKNFNGLIELSSAQILGDKVSGEQLQPTTFEISKLSESTAVKNYQSLFVKLENVTVGDVVTDQNGNTMIKLLQGAKSLDLYGVNYADLTSNDIYKDDIITIVGHLNFYQKTVSGSLVGGFRLEVVGTPDDYAPIATRTKTAHTLNFYASLDDYASGIELYTITNIRNISVTTPTAPVLPGKTFIEWRSIEGGSPLPLTNTFDMPNFNGNYYAAYEDAVYTVTFVSGTTESFANITCGYNDEITLPSPTITKANCTFGGWYTDANFTTAFTSNSKITSNTTLYAKWIAKPAENNGNTTLIIVIVITSVLVVAGGSILVVYLLKSRKPKTK